MEVGKLSEIVQGQTCITMLGLTPATTVVEQASSKYGLTHETPGNTQGLPVEQVQEPSSDSRRKNGDVSIYKYYITSSGYGIVMANILSMFVWIACTEFSSQLTKLLAGLQSRC